MCRGSRSARAAGAIAVILVGGRFLIRPAFRAIGGARTPEVFTALALFVVAGAAALADAAGLSMSLGAFLAGVLLSDSEYRHEVQADVEPFEGLLLGFFFLSVGMSANLGLAAARALVLRRGRAGLHGGQGRRRLRAGAARGQAGRTALRFALALPQGSEFSFVLFGAAVGGRRAERRPSRTARRWRSRCRWRRRRCCSPLSERSLDAAARARRRAAAPTTRSRTTARRSSSAASAGSARSSAAC